MPHNSRQSCVLCRTPPSCLLRLIVLICRLTPEPPAGLDLKKVAHFSTFSLVGSIFLFSPFCSTPPFVAFFPTSSNTPPLTPTDSSVHLCTRWCCRLRSKLNLRHYPDCPLRADSPGTPSMIYLSPAPWLSAGPRGPKTSPEGIFLCSRLSNPGLVRRVCSNNPSLCSNWSQSVLWNHFRFLPFILLYLIVCF